MMFQSEPCVSENGAKRNNMAKKNGVCCRLPPSGAETGGGQDGEAPALSASLILYGNRGESSTGKGKISQDF